MNATLLASSMLRNDSPETRRCSCKDGRTYQDWMSVCCAALPIGEVFEEDKHHANGLCRNCGCMTTFDRESIPCATCDGDHVIYPGAKP